MKRTLALFPLDTVLFPNAALPLKIFEERYKQMINACLDSGQPFGVTLISKGEEVGGDSQSFAVGCLADIEKVKRRPDGKMNLLLRGMERFRVLKEIQKTPYIKAEIETMADEAGEKRSIEQSKKNLRESLKHYANVFLMLTSKQLEFERHFEDDAALSWFVADLLQGANEDKQRLLQTFDCAERLKMEEALLTREVEHLKVLWEKYKYSKN